MKAVILESYVMEEGDLDWSGVKALVPDTTSYVRTAYEEIAPRIGDADIGLLNKCRMDEEILQQCPNLKCHVEIHGYNIFLFWNIAFKMQQILLIDQRTGRYKYSCNYQLYFFRKKALKAHLIYCF